MSKSFKHYILRYLPPLAGPSSGRHSGPGECDPQESSSSQVLVLRQDATGCFTAEFMFPAMNVASTVFCQHQKLKLLSDAYHHKVVVVDADHNEYTVMEVKVSFASTHADVLASGRRPTAKQNHMDLSSRLSLETDRDRGAEPWFTNGSVE